MGARRRQNAARSIEARFWTKVDKAGPVLVSALGECWTWTASRDRRGYGRFWLSEHTFVGAHRAAWLLERGNPGDAHVLHRCDNPACVRVAHLFLGTHADNMADASAKGRMHIGTAHGQARANETVVRAVRAAHARGVSRSKLMATFGLGAGTVQAIVHRKTWRHVDAHE